MSVPIPNELLESVAMQMAVGNNGGTWDTHYTETQKELWRTRAFHVIDDVRHYFEEQS